MKKKIYLGIVLLVVAAISLIGCASSSKDSADGSDNNQQQVTEAEQYNVRFAVEGYPDSVQHLYAQEFKRVIEEKSDGNITVEIYTGGQLGDAEDQTELLQNGGIEFAISSALLTGTIVPENQLFSIHFLLFDDMELNKELFTTSKALNEELSNAYLEKNIKILSYWPEGYSHWTTNKPINRPEDFQGLNMRAYNSPMIISAYENYGANATPLPYAEVYSGLQLGVIDGQENPIAAIDDAKFHEVQDYLTMSYHSIFVCTTAVNPDFFNSLSEEYQQIVLDTVEELVDFSFEIGEQIDQERLEKIKLESDIQITELTPEERDAFRQASQPSREKYIEMVGERGERILTMFEEEIEAIRAKQ